MLINPLQMFLKYSWIFLFPSALTPAASISIIKFGCFSCNFFIFLMEFGKLEGEFKNYLATWATYLCYDYLNDKEMA